MTRVLFDVEPLFLDTLERRALLRTGSTEERAVYGKAKALTKPTRDFIRHRPAQALPPLPAQLPARHDQIRRRGPVDPRARRRRVGRRRAGRAGGQERRQRGRDEVFRVPGEMRGVCEAGARRGRGVGCFGGF